MRVRVSVGATIALILLGSCTPPIDPAPRLSADQARPVLRIQQVPTYLAVGAKFRLRPHTVYASGWILYPAPVSAASAAAELAVPVLLMRQLSQTGLRELGREAVEAGLHERADYGSPGVIDAPVTLVSFTYNGQETVSRIVALDFAEAGMLTSEQRLARAKVRAFVDRYTSQAGLPSAFFAGEAQPYTAANLAVHAARDENPEPEVAAGARQWPLGDLGRTGQPIDFGRCQVLSGPDLTKVMAATAGVSHGTLWRSGEAVYQVAFRPLLPDEPDCFALQ